MSIKKKLGLGVGSLALGAALIGGGTFAYFNDTESSTGNTFAAGTIELTPDLPGGAIFNVANAKPGATFDTGVGTLKNTGSLPANLSVTLNETDIDAHLNGTGIVGDAVKITQFNVNGSNKIADIDALTTDHNGTVTLSELKNVVYPVGALASQGTVTIQVKGEFTDTGVAQNQYQGDQSKVDFTFELKQQ
jgi:spore coat-associated protein N